MSDIITMIKSRRMRLVVHVACMGDIRNIYRILVRKLKGKRLLGRTRHKWEDDIAMNLRGIGWEVVDWIHMAHVRNVGGLLSLW
jgi:hypothetical protein